MKFANESQVGGAHYAGEVQHWDYAVAQFGIGYLQGQITKYACRWRSKNGLQDLQKAAHFLQKLQEVLHARRLRETGVRGFLLRLTRLVYANLHTYSVRAEDVRGLNNYAEAIVAHCVERCDPASLRRAGAVLQALICAAKDADKLRGLNTYTADALGKDSWEHATPTPAYVNQDPGRPE